MYRDLRNMFWWNKTNAEIVDYVFQCVTCQQISSLLNPFSTSKWKWEHITRIFVSEKMVNLYSIHTRMVNLKGQFKFWRACWLLVPSILKGRGKNICIRHNSLKITTIMSIFKWYWNKIVLHVHYSPEVIMTCVVVVIESTSNCNCVFYFLFFAFFFSVVAMSLLQKII